LVRVAQSNVELARKELEQTTDRFQAGVDDNLPVVQAQATLANAESNLIDTTSQHNQAKLGLARNLGIVDTQYATYLHGN
jgi:outer membrane protein TolC